MSVRDPESTQNFIVIIGDASLVFYSIAFSIKVLSVVE